MNKRAYKYKLDFYYKSLALYLITLVIYILIKGKFFQARFEVVVKDPIIYIISIFIFFYLILLVLNALRGREIIFETDSIIFKNRFGQKVINLNEIIQIRFSREKKRMREERSDSRIIKLKLNHRRRMIRVKLSDFNDEKELMNEFKNISKNLTQK
ncbi:MAG TPA: hypothetical protein PK294_05855 [Ignavibacteria bacterium]|nr:hypothetical protein [Ignavibacteria bacterium]HQY51251.1 hypothetical protein [Ignavibacteria bacterium]HRA99941.1 hypothetical protein [Ignavibacteria bacterium]